MDLKEFVKRFKYIENNKYKEFYPNGYGISIVPDIENLNFYEVAVLKGTEENSEPCYNTPITDGVITGITLEEAHKIAKEVSELEENTYIN